MTAGRSIRSRFFTVDLTTPAHRLLELPYVAVLKRSEMLRTIPDAIAASGDSLNIIWCTGPSKTADGEGILIEDVHGPGEQIVFLIETEPE